MAKRGRKKGSSRPRSLGAGAGSTPSKDTSVDHGVEEYEGTPNEEEDEVQQQEEEEEEEERERPKASGKRGNRLTSRRGRSACADGSRVTSNSSTSSTGRSRRKSCSLSSGSRGRGRRGGGANGKDHLYYDDDPDNDAEADDGEGEEAVDSSSPESDEEQQQSNKYSAHYKRRTRKRSSPAVTGSTSPTPTNLPATRRAQSGRRCSASSAIHGSSTSATTSGTRKSTRSSSGSNSALTATNREPESEPPRLKVPKIPPPPLPEAPGLGQEILSRASVFLPTTEDVAEKAKGNAARGRIGGSGTAVVVGTGTSDSEAALDAIDPNFLEDLLTCWDFLHLMGVAQTEVST